MELWFVAQQLFVHNKIVDTGPSVVHTTPDFEPTLTSRIKTGYHYEVGKSFDDRTVRVRENIGKVRPTVEVSPRHTSSDIRLGSSLHMYMHINS
ncbi:unnamed protein product [Hermetia illucens]|uniref:Uncharacterized protein n=1 Tax=Hermetia illucens TaxID=343691 RepID=A0A7R8Z2Z3_HERIL|nr:unnamed protein product [Hermetia illucens]